MFLLSRNDCFPILFYSENFSIDCQTSFKVWGNFVAVLCYSMFCIFLLRLFDSLPLTLSHVISFGKGFLSSHTSFCSAVSHCYVKLSPCLFDLYCCDKNYWKKFVAERKRQLRANRFETDPSHVCMNEHLTSWGSLGTVLLSNKTLTLNLRNSVFPKHETL